MDHSLPIPSVPVNLPLARSQSVADTPQSLPPADLRAPDKNDFAVFSSAAREALQRGYQQLQNSQGGGVAAVTGKTPTPEDSAAVILGFIESRLQRQATAGAEGEGLSELLQQGLEGFRKGLEEARTILQQLNRLSEDVAAGIAETENRVLQGLAAIADSYGLATPVEPEAEAADTASVAPVSTDRTAQSAPVVSRAAYFQAAFERRESVQLELETRDGDRITLSLNNFASSSLAIAGASASGPRGDSAILAYQQTQQLQSRFSFSVEGELDEDELKALRLLLNDVAAISDEFFEGNFEQAFKLALSLNLDQEAFSSLSLDLSLLTRSSVIAGTRSSLAEPATDTPAQSATPADQGLTQLQRLLDMLQLANRFARPGDLLTELLAARLADKSVTDTAPAAGA